MDAPATPFDDGKLYDLLFERFDMGIDFYLDLARQIPTRTGSRGGPILDVACGTGRVTLPLLKAGFEVHGLDLFPSMLARLREKAKAAGFDPPLFQSPMSSFSLKHRYALIIIPFNSIIHNLTAADQISTLRCCFEHLEPGGLLAFDTYFPGPDQLMAPENKRDLEAETPHPETGLPVRIYDTRSFNRNEQLQHSKIDIELLDTAGNVVKVHKSETTIRWMYKNELELLLQLAGFKEWQIFSDFEGHPVTKDTQAAIVQARKDAR